MVLKVLGQEEEPSVECSLKVPHYSPPPWTSCKPWRSQRITPAWALSFPDGKSLVTALPCSACPVHGALGVLTWALSSSTWY